jgi:hypothetical protein
VARTTGYGLVQLSLETHGVEYDGSEIPGYGFPLTSDWLEYTTVWPTNPYTHQPWTIQEINDLRVGVSLYETSGDARCTQVYVEVYYTPQVAFVSAGAGSAREGDGTNDPLPTYPAGLQANDLILLQVMVSDTSTTPTTPAGFTLLFGPDSTGAGRQWIYYKFATGTESGELRVSVSGSVMSMARMYAFRYVSLSSFTEGGSFYSETGPTILACSVTTTGSGRLAVSFVFVNDNNNVHHFTGETGGNWMEAVSEFQYDGNTDGTLQLQIATMASAGTISGGSYTMSYSDPWGVRAFALIPES